MRSRRQATRFSGLRFAGPRLDDEILDGIGGSATGGVDVAVDRRTEVRLRDELATGGGTAGEPTSPHEPATDRSDEDFFPTDEAVPAGVPPLRRILVGVDLVMLALGWTIGVTVARLLGAELTVLAAASQGTLVVFGGGMLISANGLYRRRICSIRSQEIARIGTTCLALAVAALLLLLGLGLPFETAGTAALVAGAAWLLLLIVERGLFREWIQGRRAAGDYGAPVVVVAGNVGAAESTASFLDDNPFLGYRVEGLVSPDGRARDPRFTWLGDADDLVERVQLVGASGAFLDAASLDAEDLNVAVELLTAANLHVHVSSGLRGVDRRRITLSPLADETFLHVKPLGLTRRQVVIKRVTDVAIGSIGLLLSAPIFAVAALVIWAYDRGPVLYRQERVGQNGERFKLYKLRSMVVDAESRLEELQDENGRSGPLFKVSRDPRITPFGRFLRASSVDEIPQLFNVLEGTMSMVGPRPALPAEVAQFDEGLHARMTVKPGVTGLWQVEARDLPNFDLYRRFDLLYVRNWSLALDLSIIARTVTVVGVRAISAFLPARFKRSTVLE